MKKLLLLLLLNSALLFSKERASSYPYLSGDTWRFFCDLVLSEHKGFNPESVEPGDTIFVEYDSLDDFKLHYLPAIKNKFILITPNCERGSDNPLPGRHTSLLDAETLAAWFLQNIDCEPTEKIIPIPIGLANCIWEHGNPDLLNHFIPISLNTPMEGKNIFVYVNFALGTNPQERNTCRNHFLLDGFAHVTNPKAFPDYLTDLSQTIFVASPPGNGADCHRTWEALLMGCYPIVKSSHLNPLYEDLPVVIVNDWIEATEEFLNMKYLEFSSTNWPREKLYAPYWFQKVREIQNKLRAETVFKKRRSLISIGLAVPSLIPSAAAGSGIISRILSCEMDCAEI